MPVTGEVTTVTGGLTQQVVLDDQDGASGVDFALKQRGADLSVTISSVGTPGKVRSGLQMKLPVIVTNIGGVDLANILKKQLNMACLDSKRCASKDKLGEDLPNWWNWLVFFWKCKAQGSGCEYRMAIFGRNVYKIVIRELRQDSRRGEDVRAR